MSFRAVLRGLAALPGLAHDVAAVRTAVVTDLPNRLERIKELIMSKADDLAARIDAATTKVADELKEVRDELAAAVANTDAATQAAVNEALGKLDAPISRLESLGADSSDPVPAEPGDDGHDDGSDNAPSEPETV